MSTNGSSKKTKKPDTPPPTPIGDLREDVAIKLIRLATDYRSVCDDFAALETLKKSAGAELKEFMESHGLTRVRGDGWVVRPHPNVYRAISAEKLLAAGVGMEVIEECTVEQTSVSYVVQRKENEQ